jgi:hypothetical protein
MQYLPLASDSLQVRFIGDDAFTGFVVKFLLFLLFRHVFVTNEVDNDGLFGMNISAFDKHSTFWQSDAVSTVLSGIIISSWMLHGLCFPSVDADSKLALSQDTSDILCFVFLCKQIGNFICKFNSTSFSIQKE